MKRTGQLGGFMARLRTKILSGGEVVTGVVNYLLITKPALYLQTILNANIGTVDTGVSITQSPSSVLTPQNPALLISTSATGTINQEIQNPSLLLSQNNAGTISKPEQTPSFEIQQLVVNLTRLVGGNSAAITTAGTQGWTNQNNSVSGTNGKHDSTVATFTGNITAARNGTLILSYADHTNKTELTITSVKLKFYYQTAGTTLNNADVQLKWNKGGADTTLATIVANVNFIATGEEYDITSSISSWADLDALQTKVTCDSTATETWTCTVDAIEVEIVANRTESL